MEPFICQSPQALLPHSGNLTNKTNIARNPRLGIGLQCTAMLDCVTDIENGPFLAEREDRELVNASTISERPSEVQILDK